MDTAVPGNRLDDLVAPDIRYFADSRGNTQARFRDTDKFRPDTKFGLSRHPRR